MLSRCTGCRLRCSTPCSARSSSLQERSTTLRRCPACFGRRPIWQLWAFGDPRLVRVVTIWTLYTRAGSARFVPCVVRSHPVGSLSRSSRTASLHRFMLDLVDELTLILKINRFSPVLVVINLINVVHVSDGTSCWTVILTNDRAAILLWI